MLTYILSSVCFKARVPSLSTAPSSMHQQPTSRPNSGMGGMQQPYQDNRQAQPSKSSVVIKVGMVGDAQIGKTSLMVKYVEGSWDEDYIQTLGASARITAAFKFILTVYSQALTSWRRPYLFGTPKSPFPYGISAANENSSICSH